MSTKNTPITELQRMSATELRRELLAKRAEVAKMRMNLELQSEKNHTPYQQGRKEVARMTMVLKQMERGGVKKEVTKDVPAKPETEMPKKKASQSEKKTVKRPGSKKKAS